MRIGSSSSQHSSYHHTYADVSRRSGAGRPSSPARRPASGGRLPSCWPREAMRLVLTARRARSAGGRWPPTLRRAAWRAHVHIIVADLADPAAPARLADANWRARGLRVDVLVNNAGYGVPGQLPEEPVGRPRRFIQVMVTAVCELTHRLLPGHDRARLGPHHQRRVAGRPGAGAGRPHAVRRVEGVPDPLLRVAGRREHARDGVHVTRRCAPGSPTASSTTCTGTREQMSGMPAAHVDGRRPTVAREGYDAVMRGRVGATSTAGSTARLVWLARVHAAGPSTSWVTGRAGTQLPQDLNEPRPRTELYTRTQLKPPSRRARPSLC